MHAVGLRRERHVDPVVDQERHAERHERRLHRARGLDHGARIAALVPELNQCRAAGRDQLRELGQGAPARVLGIDNGIQTKIDRHRLIRIVAFHLGT